MSSRSRIVGLVALAVVACGAIAIGFGSKGSKSEPPSSVTLQSSGPETSVVTGPPVAELQPAVQPPVRNVSELVRDARIALTENRPASAETLLLQAAAMAPREARVWNTLGRAQLAQGRVDEARSSFERACEVDSSHAWARNNLAWLEMQSGNWSRAQSLLETAIDLQDDVPAFHNNLANVYEHTGQFDAAEREYARTIELRPEHPTATVALARLHSHRSPVETMAVADSAGSQTAQNEHR